MPTTAPDNIVTPDDTALYDYIVDLAAFADSVQDAFNTRLSIVRVANTSERTTYRTLFGTTFGTPTAGNPCVVYRADATAGMRLEIDTGSGFSVWLSHLQPTIQTFTASGTYTAPTGLLYAVVEVQAGGGGGGGCATTGATQIAAGSPGTGGVYARKTLSASTIGASQTVTVGGGGSGGTAGANSGSNGGDSSFGALVTATGGNGGAGSAALSSTSGPLALTVPPSTGTGDIVIPPPGVGYPAVNAGFTVCRAAAGGSSFLGTGGVLAAANSAGVAATAGYGGGGSGANNSQSQGSARAGGAGKAGIVIVTEYY